MKEIIVLYTRMEPEFEKAHVPNSLSICMDSLPNFGGWFLPYDKAILVVKENNKPTKAVCYLIRLRYDNIEDYPSGGMFT